MKKFWLSLMAVCFCMSADAGESAVFAAHEWGTFTSVQGSDGVQLEWNPYVVAELPTFVYDRNRPNHEANRPNFAIFAAKTAFLAKQRMETPVIYFYSPEKKNVDVRVDFPSGLMTEWFPHATSCDAQRLQPGDTRPRMSFLEWKNIEVAPSSEPVGNKLQTDKGKSHYYAARETDASLLRIKNEAKGSVETEKFLFYRGVGHFEAPLNVTQQGDGKFLAMQNAGKETVRHLLVLQVGQDKGGATYSIIALPELGHGLTEKIDLSQMKNASREELKASLEAALTTEGLYPAEAKSMVKTWEDSWLDEPGVRVLYVLGREWTDRTLPLQISPKPQQLARVMVGRAELITPKIELALREAIDEYAKGDAIAQQKAVAKARALGLGRFQEPAARLLIKKNPGAQFSKAAFELASKSSHPPTTPPLALK
jgi:hypothetical protein